MTGSKSTSQIENGTSGHSRSATSTNPSNLKNPTSITKHQRSATSSNLEGSSSSSRSNFLPRDELIRSKETGVRNGNGSGNGISGNGLTAWEFLNEPPSSPAIPNGKPEKPKEPRIPDFSLFAMEEQESTSTTKNDKGKGKAKEEPSNSLSEGEKPSTSNEQKELKEKEVDRVSIAISPLIDVITMFGSTQTSSNYSLSGTVVLSVRPNPTSSLDHLTSKGKGKEISQTSNPEKKNSIHRRSTSVIPPPISTSGSSKLGKVRPESLMSPTNKKSPLTPSSANSTRDEIPTPTLSELRAFAKLHSNDKGQDDEEERNDPISPTSPNGTQVDDDEARGLMSSSSNTFQSLHDFPPSTSSITADQSGNNVAYRFSTATEASYRTALPSPSPFPNSPSLMITSPSSDSYLSSQSLSSPLSPTSSSNLSDQRTKRKLKAVAEAEAKLGGGQSLLSEDNTLEEENPTGKKSQDDNEAEEETETNSRRSSISEPKTPKSIMDELSAAVAESERLGQEQAADNEEVQEKKAELKVTSLKVNFSGYSMYVDSAGRFSALKLADITKELLPQGSILPISSDHSSKGESMKYDIEFDLSIPGWLPASMRSRFGGNFYCISSEARFTETRNDGQEIVRKTQIGSSSSIGNRYLPLISPSSPHTLSGSPGPAMETQEILASPTTMASSSFGPSISSAPAGIRDFSSSSSASERSHRNPTDDQLLSAPSDVGERRGSNSASINSSTSGNESGTRGDVSSGNLTEDESNAPMTSIFGEAAPNSTIRSSVSAIHNHSREGSGSRERERGEGRNDSLNQNKAKESSKSNANSNQVSKAKGNWLSKGAKRLTIMGRPSSTSSPRSGPYDTKMLNSSAPRSGRTTLDKSTTMQSTTFLTQVPKRIRNGIARTVRLEAEGCSIAYSHSVTIIIRRCRDVVAVPVARLALLNPGEESQAVQDAEPNVNNSVDSSNATPDSAQRPPPTQPPSSETMSTLRPPTTTIPIPTASSTSTATPASSTASSQTTGPASTPSAASLAPSLPLSNPPRAQTQASTPQDTAPTPARPSQILPIAPSALSGPADPSKFAAAAAAAAQQPQTPTRNASSTATRSSRNGGSGSNPPMRHFLHRPVLHPPAEAGITPEGEGLLFSLTLSLPSHVQVDGPNSDTLSFGVQIEVGRTEGWAKVRELGGLRLRDMELVCLQTERHR